MSVVSLKALYQTLCSEFDREVREKHREEVRVMFGICPDHFFQRLTTRIIGEDALYLRDQILAAAFKYILIKYEFFSKLNKDYEFSVGYRGWKICYKCYVITLDSQPRYIEIIPVTVFRHVLK